MENYVLISESNFNELKPGGYVRYQKITTKKRGSGILIKTNYPAVTLKSFISNKKWHINILENVIYYKSNAAPGYNKMFKHLLEGLEKKTIIIE